MRNWSQLVVPIIFLVLWGLKQLIEREPPRPAVRPMPPGPRPAAPVATRFGTPPPRPSEEILVIRSETGRPDPAGNRPNPGRRPQRPKSAPTADGQRPRSQTLGGDISRLTSQPLRGLGPISLNQGRADISLPTAAEVFTDAFGSAAIFEIVHNPARLREAFILNEILQPPVSMRNKRPRI